MIEHRPYRVIIVAPTCFYYQVELFRELAAAERIDLSVIFCSDEGYSGKDIKVAYGVDQDWGVKDDLLNGYDYKFLRNYSPWGSYLKSLVGLANFGILKEISSARPDAVVVMSWMNPTWWMAGLVCLILKIPILFMTDANIDAEARKSPWKSWFKHLLLGKFLFRFTSGFLCAGTANKRLYTLFNVKKEKLFPFAYSWGYKRLLMESIRLNHRKEELRAEYGVPSDAFVVLYCGRLSKEKGSLELIKAYDLVSHPKKALVLVGDGIFREPINSFAEEHGIDSIHFMGFQPRNMIGKFYALADVLVLPSQKETWGMVINEGLCFSLPVIASDQVGAAADLVIPDQNGFIFPAGDVSALAGYITAFGELPDEQKLEMGGKSLKLIMDWSDRDLGALMGTYLDSIYEARG